MTSALIVAVAVLSVALAWCLWLLLSGGTGQPKFAGRFKSLWASRASHFRQFRYGMGDFFVASRLGFPLAICLTVLYYGQYWVLSSVALGKSPTSFFTLHPRRMPEAFFFLFVLALAFVAYRFPFTKALTAIKDFLLTYSSTDKASEKHLIKHAFSHLGHSTTSLIICLAMLAILLGEGIEGFLDNTKHHIPVEIVHTILFLIPIVATLIANRLKRDTVSDNAAHASLINAFLATSVIIFLSCRYWSYSNDVILSHASSLSPAVTDLMRLILMHDLLVFGLLSTLAILPFTHFVGHPKLTWQASLLLYSGMVVLICVAWLVTQTGDQTYLSRVQNSSSVYYQEFPNAWQKLQVEGWIYTREALLALMIVLAIIYGIQELWLHPWRTLRLEKVNNHHLSIDDVHKLKDGIEKIAERRRWFIIVKTKHNAHNAVFVKTTKRRLAYCLKRLCDDRDVPHFSHPLKVHSDLGTIVAKEHTATWEKATQKS